MCRLSSSPARRTGCCRRSMRAGSQRRSRTRGCSSFAAPATARCWNSRKPSTRRSTTSHSARWDDEARHWDLDTSAGPLTADAVITAHGFLSEPAIPDIKGLDTFSGQIMHSAQWDPSYDVTGKRVAVIGTGASAVQIVPRVHETARHLHVFQRTAAWILPHRARPIRDWERKVYRRVPAAQRVVRNAVYYRSEFLFLP